jgi:hypothetical protein
MKRVAWFILFFFLFFFFYVFYIEVAGDIFLQNIFDFLWITQRYIPENKNF